MITDQFNPKALPKAYHSATARVMGRLPAHEVLRRRPDGSAHQMFNIIIGEPLAVLNNEVQRFEDNRYPSTTPVDQMDILYSVPLPANWGDYESPNVLRNSMFEFLDVDLLLPSGWYMFGSGDCHIVEGETYAGRYALEMNVSGDPIGIGQDIDDLEANYGDPLTLSVWTHAESGEPIINLQLVAKNMLTGDFQSVTSLAFTPDIDDWTRLVLTLERTTFPSTDFKAYISASGAGVVHVDAAQLEKEATPTPWKARSDDCPPWNVTGAWQTDAEYWDNGDRREIYYCDNYYDFFNHAVPTFAEIDESVTADYAAPNPAWDFKIDSFNDQYLMGFSVSGDRILRDNLTVPGETICEYILKGMDAQGLYNGYSGEFIGLTMLRSLLYVLETSGDGYNLLCVNPQTEQPDSSGFYILNRLPVEGIDIVPSGATVSLGLDTYDPDQLSLRVSPSGSDEVTDYRLRLWYDYYMPDAGNRLLMFREDYRDVGGVELH